MTSEPQLKQYYEQMQGQKQQLRRWIKFVLFWIFVIVPKLKIHYKSEQFEKLKSIMTERMEKLESISLLYIVIGCVFLISVLVNMHCLDRNSCKLSESVVSPVPPSGYAKCKRDPCGKLKEAFR